MRRISCPPLSDFPDRGRRGQILQQNITAEQINVQAVYIAVFADGYEFQRKEDAQKWNGGDMKSVQGDSGHAQMDMIADVYSHIIDEDRRFNAQKFEEQFYKTKGLRTEEGTVVPTPKFEHIEEKTKTEAYGEKIEKPPEPEKETEPEQAQKQADDGLNVLTKLLSNPETAALLKALAKNI